MGAINDTLIKAMKEVAQGTVDKAGFDKTRHCMIMSTANANNTYTVNMDGRDYDNIPCYGGGSFNIGDVTKIYIPNNQMSQAYIEKIIGGSGSATWGSITGTLSNQTDLQTALSGKQATISDLSTIRSGASAGATAYQKPASGIPKTDLASVVQASLDKADTALQTHQSLSAYRTSADQDTIDDALEDDIDAKYTKPSSGIPDSDLAEAHYTESEANALLAGKANTSHTQTLSTITDVTATASEVNVLDGVTATTSEINLLDGKTSDNLRKITVSTTDIGVGGNLTTGELYFVYEA